VLLLKGIENNTGNLTEFLPFRARKHSFSGVFGCETAKLAKKRCRDR
jgi:hypothetical protein